jgi:hypothetical protein
VLTLVAGLSSTVFAPLTSQLLERFDWRGTYLLLAVVLAVVTVPLHAFALTPPWTTPPIEVRDGAPMVHRRVPAEVRTPGFLLLSGALTLTAFGLYAASLTLIPLLNGRGFTATPRQVPRRITQQANALGYTEVFSPEFAFGVSA